MSRPPESIRKGRKPPIPRILVALAIGGMGGCLPSLIKMGTFLAANPEELPGLGALVALVVYFVIGGAVAAAVATPTYKFKEFLIAGICAPGIATNFVAGVNDGGSQRPLPATVSEPHASIADVLFSSAHAGVLGAADSADVASATLTVYVRAAKSNAPPDLQSLPINVIVGGRTFAIPPRSGAVRTRALTVGVPKEAARVQFDSGGQTVALELPTGATASFVELTVQTEGKRDFLWALGGKRQTRVSAMSALLRSHTSDAGDDLVGAWTISEWRLPADVGLVRPEATFTGDLVISKNSATGAPEGIATFYLDGTTRVTETFKIESGETIVMRGTVTESGARWLPDRFYMRLDDDVLSGRVADQQGGDSRVSYIRITAPLAK